MKSRSPSVESLERRQLLAGDLCLAADPIERIATSESSAIGSDIFVPGNIPIDAPAGDVVFAPSISPRFLPAPFLPGPLIPDIWIDRPSVFPMTGSDLLQEDGGLIAAVRTPLFSSIPFSSIPFTSIPNDSRPVATLHLFDRQEDGSLDESAAIDLQFVPRQVFLTERLVIAIGTSSQSDPTGMPRATTALLSVSRDDLTDQTTVNLEGVLTGVVERDDRLFVSTFRPPHLVPLIAPPPTFPHNITVFDAGGSSLSRIAVGELPVPVADNMIVGNDILVVEQLHESETIDERSLSNVTTTPIASNEFSHHLVRYRIEGDSIERIASLKLFADFNLQAEIADDGATAVVFGQQDVAFPAVVGGPQAGFTVALIDLSEDQPRLFQSVEVATRGDQTIAEIGRQAVVITDGRNQLIVVDINQASDVDAPNRVKRIELPGIPDQTYPGITSVTELSSGTFAIVRRSFTSTSENDEIVSRREVELLTLSLSDDSVVSQTVPDSSALAIFSPSSSRPTLIGLGRFFAAQETRQLVVGNIDGTGQFNQQATIDLAGSMEIDVDANRLLLRRIDQLVEYPWDSIDEPIVTPLGDPLPGPSAVDDVLRRNSESRDRYLNVLANDQLVGHLGYAQIVELVDAPAGIVIATGGNVLRLTEQAWGTEGTFEFQYVVQQGHQRSSATVTLTLFRYDDDDVGQAVDGVLTRAAEDLGVDQSDIRIGSVRRYTDLPLPGVIGSAIENPLAGQFGVIVDVLAGDDIFRYAANFEGEVVRLSSQQFEIVMELSLRAVDARGNAIESIQTGDEFFVEVTAEDLREFGFGVFAIAFDLPLPTNKLELTGELVLLGKFDDFGDPVDAEGIDEFHALEVLIDHPGSEPQPVVRFGVRAVAGGEVTLQLDPAESRGAELLLRGRDDEVSPLEVRFGSLDLKIDGIEPTDTDGSGAVTPSDALRVINFLGIYGSVAVNDLPQLTSAREGEDIELQLRSMRRLDTNADGQISARDALHVINDLARLFRRDDAASDGETGAEAELVDAAIASDFLSEEDDDDTLQSVIQALN